MASLCRIALSVVTFCLWILPAQASVIWTGPDTVFTRAPNVDWTLPANQDHLAGDISLTRASTAGLFNIAGESAYTHNFSPSGTEWAYGTTANLGSLTFTNWESWNGKNPPSMVGKDAVLHLIPEDAYVDIKFLSWDTTGGGFSYERSTVPEPTTMVALLVGAATLLRRRRK